MKRIVIPVVMVFLCGLALVLLWSKPGTASLSGSAVENSSGNHRPMSQAVNEINANPLVMSALDVVLNEGSDDNSRKFAGLELIMALHQNLWCFSIDFPLS